MKTLALSAFACDPTKGSEPGNGWNWAIGLANRGYEVHCFTRIIGKEGIEKTPKPNNLLFHYIVLPFGAEKLYASSTAGMYLYYILWQWLAAKKAKEIHKSVKFSLAHHVTWGSTQMGSFMYRIGIPFVFGPAGGGQVAPDSFQSYFGKHWQEEIARTKITHLMVKFNPAFKRMLRKAYAVLVSNPDTKVLAENAGAKNVHFTLDAALAEGFFPQHRVEKKVVFGKLQLLWVGRFMPRKGILLLLDVMKVLTDYPGITLTVVGDGEMKESFLQKIEEYGLENTVIWKGKVPYDEVKKYYSSHDVFFFTSLRDSCPAQLIEAMAYSMPVVTINLHGQAIIVNSETGIICNCEEPNETIILLKNAILKFYNNSDLVVTKGAAAYSFALKQTWNRKINDIVNKYYPV